MINCLSSSKFANLLFVNVQIENVNAIALFDTGAGMTVISKSLLHRFCAVPEKETLRAGNNNGMVREFQTAAIPGIRIGDICVEKCKVLVTDDADFAHSDESGRIFPAEMLLGWDDLTPGIPAPSSAPLCILGFLTFTITKPKLLVSGLHNINGFPMCGNCSFGFKTRRLLYRMSIFATSYTVNRRR